MHVFAGSAHKTVQLVSGVHPFLGKSPSDRMCGVAVNDQEIVLKPMVAADSRAGVVHNFSVFPEDIRTCCFIPVAPSPQAIDLVILLPVWEGVIRRMVDHDSAPASDIIHECVSRGRVPVVAVVIEDHQLVGREIGIECIHIAALGRACGHIHFKKACILHDLLQYRGAGFPVVVVLTGDDQSLQRGGCRRFRKRRERDPGQQTQGEDCEYPCVYWCLEHFFLFHH